MNPISVNPMAVGALPLRDQLEVFRGLDIDHFGLTITACAQNGWEDSLRALGNLRPTLAYLCHGPSASADDPASWEKESVLLRQAVDFAALAGAPQIYFTTGRQGKLVWEDAAAKVSTFLMPLVNYAADQGVRIVLENSMAIRSDISFTHSVRDTAHLAALVGADLCVDLYCCWGEADLARTLTDNLDRIAMVQLSDMELGDLDLPNRRVPSEGDLPLEALVSMVIHLGYMGLIDVELIGPEIAREGERAALKRSVEWLKELLHTQYENQ